MEFGGGRVVCRNSTKTGTNVTATLFQIPVGYPDEHAHAFYVTLDVRTSRLLHIRGLDVSRGAAVTGLCFSATFVGCLICF